MGKCRLSGETMAEKKNNTTTLILAAGVIGAIIFLLSEGLNVDFWKEKITTLTGRNGVQEQMSTVSLEQQVNKQLESVSAGKQKTSQPVENKKHLNEKGVALVLKKKLWEGMYCFEQAIRENPSDLAPLINMIAVLSELGLSKPAERFISMARKVDPGHPLLRTMLSDEIYVKTKEEMELALIKMEQEQSGGELSRDLYHTEVRLWGDDLLMMWGVDDSRLY